MKSLGKTMPTKVLSREQTKAASDLRLPVFMTTAEVAYFLRYTETTVRRQARSGRLPGRRFGKEWRFPTNVILSAYRSRFVP